MTEESAVAVCVRVRPLIEREESGALENAEPVQLFWKADKKSIHQIDDGNSTKSFSFDRVFTADETTNQLYQTIAKPLVVSTVEGYNGTIFAYGQTSSGKTFTMMGSKGTPGVIPLAVEDVFQTIKNFPKKEFLLRVSYMEIYNETVTDLLVDSWKRKPLEIRETINKNIYVADLTEELVTTPAQALAWIRKGEKNRHYGKTKMNQRSSRSHTMFRMILESRERSDPASGENADGAIIVSHLNLVDLAGSERASQTGAEGARLKEGCNINRSLFILGQVIKKVTDENQKGFTNYRDSKLTRILQNSLGGNAKTVIICTITPVALEETLSTLQFASTAKKMKNDPHVTEVSDDGALLKRYRNEIVDLKRRLQEVSSVTQTTATEKEVLSQLLQEKDQLQREQEDRIKNLTKLLVTSSNQFQSVPKMPKRRVTWGGKMLRLAHPSAFEGGISELSYAEPVGRKRKADRSCLSELCEDDEDFQWEISDEPQEDMEMSQNYVTTRSFEDSPKDPWSQDWMRDIQQKDDALTKVEALDSRVQELEQQLQTESQHKQEALEKMEMFDSRVLELEKQLQAENQQKQEALEKMETFNSRVLELEQQLQAENQQKPESLEKMEMFDSKVLELEQQLQMENQQKQESLEKMEMLELRVLDLERQLEEQSHSQSSSDEQMRREFAETIQLCEQMASEKDVVAAERNYLKDELGMFIEQTESLEKENAALLKELEERREVNEFETLEEELRNEQENKLHEEISCLKKANSDSELHCLELQKKLESLSEELKRKSDFAEELQNMNGKDLVQEVTKLRRSLDDAEGVSRDTKKEWAHLRSQNIALEEANVSLSTSHEKMKAEAESMRSQLEAEKSSFRKIQSDLEKELNVAFDENTKLTALLDGKVPKNLMDSVELERTVSNLNKELTTSRAAEETLRAQLEELASSQAQLENLMQQVRELTEELCATQTQRDGLISAQTQSQEEAQQLRDSLQASQEEILSAREEVSAATLREEQLREQLESVQSSLENSEAEKNLLNTAVEEKHSTIQSLSAELQCVREEKETLQTIAQSSAEETEKLQSAVSSLTEERDQLKTDMQESVEMMIENQEELRSALEKTKEQKKLIEQLQTAQTSKQDTLQSETSEQLEKLQTQIQSLTEQLQSVLSERDCLLSERTASSHSEEMEKLQHRVTSLSTDRDQLQETLEALREQKQQITQEMQDRVDTLQAEYAETQILLQTLENKLEEKNSDQKTLLEQKESGLMEQIQSLSAELQCVREEKETLRTLAQSSAEETEKLQSAVSSLTEERDQLKTDMQESVEMMIENQEELRAALEKNTEQKKLIEELQTAQTPNQDTPQPETSEQLEKLQTQIQSLTEQLQSVVSERDCLLSERTASSHSEEMEKLQHRVTSLSTDRDQLQETLEALREQKQQITQEMQDRVDTLQAEAAETQILLQTLENKLEEKNSNQKTLLEQKESDLLEQIQSLSAELQCVREEKETLQTLAQSSAEETEKLQSAVSSLTTERDQLKMDMQESVEMMIENQEELRAALEKNTEQKKLIEELQTTQTSKQDTLQPETSEQLEKLQTQIQSLTEQLQSILSERDFLLSERTANSQIHSEEMEKLQHRVTSLSTDRDQLQETLEALREQKQQITQEMQDRVDTLQAEMNQLQGTLQAVSQQKNQLEDDLQQNMETATQTQSRLNSLQEQLQEQTERNMEVERLSQERQTQVTEAECRLQSVQEELQQLKQKQANQMKLSEQKESDLEQQIKGLSEQLVGVQAERDDLLLEKEASCQRVSEEMRRRVTSLSTDRDQLQETLNALREQKQQITQEMQDRVDTLQAEITSLREQLSKQKVEEAEREAELQEKVQQLKEELQVTREKQTIPETEADTSQQLLSEANKSTYALQEQLSSKVRESAMSRLQESTDQLQEALKKFEDFHKFCFKYNSKALKKIQRDMPSLTHLPNTTLNLFNAVDEMGQQGFRTLGEFMDNLQARAQGYKTVFEDLVQKDLDVYEERRLQDVLQCKAQATSCSLKDEDFNMLWEQRLSRLLEKRTLCLQDMESVLGKLWKIIEPFCQELQIEMKSMERLAGNFKNIMKQPVSYGNNFLSQEQDLRSAEAHNRAKTFQSITDEHNRQAESLKLLQSQTDNELREERSRRSTLLQALEGAPLKTEPSLLKDNQRLLLKLQQTEERIRALCEEREQLEEAQITTNSRLSNHKQATQLLQTELQDSQAQVEEKESIIQTLRSKLRQSEENAPPSVAELEKLKNKLFKVETDLSSASEKHQIEIKRMTALLNGKEESLRKLKETLRKSQQQGEESFLQGEDLHARLTNPKGSLITSSVLQEKAKLEEEVKQLHLKIAELESLVSSQLVEINKWKSRAVKLKAKNKSDTDKSPPRTPAKRDLPDTSDSSIIHSPLKKFVAAPREVLDSPRKILSVKNLPDSPKVPWLNSPKSRFFDIEGSSDLISRNCPKQFFDNSGLGTVPGAAVGGLSADKKEEWWPLTQEKEQCKTQ
ncbi:centromere-associated protein E isoform X5 [Xyrichtys novacula]|uniref:Centromere-associated protein E n=1 Tax=Xyrichtys novacula TaxID=13765 RepID=A0AAV1GZQ9_XYRNO|nr:centromere-associated protein E isoform X5 [Xyrichtys novacula]